MIEERAKSSRPISFLIIISIFIFFTVLLASVGLYFYKGILTKNVTGMQNELNLAKDRFEPDKIAQLQVLDKRLRAANEILGNHVAVSPIFKALQLITMKTVQYTKFGYELGADKDPKVIVRLSGVALGYRSVALQSDLLAKNKHLIDPVFSNLSLDDKGNVLFDLDFSVDPSFVDYKQTLLTESTGSLNANQVLTEMPH